MVKVITPSPPVAPKFITASLVRVRVGALGSPVGVLVQATSVNAANAINKIFFIYLFF
jgi:hypothetical protein